MVKVDILWIILYSSVNLNFILYSYSSFFLEVLSLILSPIICVLFTRNVELWMSSRLYTLAINAWIRSMTANFAPYLLMIDGGNGLSHGVVVLCDIWGVLNFVFGLVYTVYLMMFIWIRRQLRMRERRRKGIRVKNETSGEDLSSDDDSDGMIDNERSEANIALSDDEEQGLIDDGK